MFDIVLADPSWYYNSRANHKTRFRGGCHGHYGVMSDKEIMALPVESICNEDALLFLWGTWPKLPVVLNTMKAWGFRYTTIGFHDDDEFNFVDALEWLKLNKKCYTAFFGVGYYTKSNTEFCLIGTKGKAMKPSDNSISQVTFGVRTEHSRKPDAVHDLISKMYPDSKKVELFARRPKKGWTTVGLELGQDFRDPKVWEQLKGENNENSFAKSDSTVHGM